MIIDVQFELGVFILAMVARLGWEFCGWLIRQVKIAGQALRDYVGRLRV